MKNPANTPWPRVILHADMDAFFAAVEILDDPSLEGLPLAVGGRSARSVVATANYVARQFGVGSAMPMAIAKRRCPKLVVVPPRMHRYKEVSNQVMGVFRRYTDLVEPLSLDEAFLELSSVIEDFPDPFTLGRTVKKEIMDATDGLTASVGISSTKSVAKIASDMQKPDGLTVVHPEEIKTFLAPLPVQRLWGVGPKALERLTALGLRTIGDVARADPTTIGLLGRLGRSCARLANGIDLRPVSPRGRSKSIGWERTLSNDISSRREILACLDEAAAGVSKRLKAKEIRAHGIRLKLKTTNFTVLTRQVKLAEPTNQVEIILRTAVELLEQLELDDAFRLVGLTGFDLVTADEGVQLSLDMHDAHALEQDGAHNQI